MLTIQINTQQQVFLLSLHSSALVAVSVVNQGYEQLKQQASAMIDAAANMLRTHEKSDGADLPPNTALQLLLNADQDGQGKIDTSALSSLLNVLDTNKDGKVDTNDLPQVKLAKICRATSFALLSPIFYASDLVSCLDNRT